MSNSLESHGITTCGIFVSQAGIEPVPPAGEVQSPKHWTAKEVPHQVASLASPHINPLSLLYLPHS